MQQSMMAQQMVNPNSGQPAFATVLPITQQVSASSHLAEQLENTLHITSTYSRVSIIIVLAIYLVSIVIKIVMMFQSVTCIHV